MAQMIHSSRLAPALLAAALMLAGATAAKLLVPTDRMASHYANVSLEKVIPPRFADWRVDEGVIPLAPDPVTAAELASIYTQTLARTYVNGNGQRVMLSIAYGGDQSRELQVHRPEVCYAAQGFKIHGTSKVDLASGLGTVPAMRVLTSKLGRNEPITYWVRMGDKVVRGNVEQGVARVGFGLSGVIPDGLLVRVSTIGTDATNQYAIQDDFVRALLAAVQPEFRSYLVGTVGAGAP